MNADHGGWLTLKSTGPSSLGKSTLEAIDNGKTPSRGVGAHHHQRHRSERAARFIKQRSGAIHPPDPDIVYFQQPGGDATGDNHVQWRHWAVVCSDR
jgi:hypothetical protein